MASIHSTRLKPGSQAHPHLKSCRPPSMTLLSNYITVGVVRCQGLPHLTWRSVDIRLHAASQPDKPATVLFPSAKVVSFGALDTAANRLAHYFRRHGLRVG